jgi:predicted Rossmann fold flavoprotein
MKSLIVIGGGAAGFFGAINAAIQNPELKITILEKSQQLLGKVKVSGGGRCNVTHSCFDPKELCSYYPRGGTELLGPFNKFQPGDTIGWFLERGIELKTEEDGRMFPITDKSQTIIDCFMSEASKYKIDIRTGQGVSSIKKSDNQWLIGVGETEYFANFVLCTPGSSAQFWNLFRELGHQIIEPVPSLFTFNIKDERINPIPGLSSPNATVTFGKTECSGPVLVTHWGLSGPGILKMSAIAARELFNLNYQFQIKVNWDSNFDRSSLETYLKDIRQTQPKKHVLSFPAVGIPIKLWRALLSTISEELKWADCSNERINFIATSICECSFEVSGKSTFKEEFVTAGGIDLKEVNFKTMESRILPNIFFSGEVLNIDAVTGGFNFQAAWTCSWLAASEIAKKSLQN